MTHLVTRTKLARLVHHFTHLPKCSLRDKTTIPHSLLQFSTISERRRVELPKELSKHVIKLSCESTAVGGVCDIYVVGTNHFSEKSSKQVEDIVNFLKPETVFLELCSSPRHNPFFVPTVEDMIALWKKKQNSIFRILYGRVVLGDRLVQITFKRTCWRALPLKHILRFLNPDSIRSLSTSDIVKLCQSDNGEFLPLALQITSEMLPSVMETLMHERDQYISYTLLKVASESRLVVAIVGRGHLQGIKKNWKQPMKIRDLITVPVILMMGIFAYVGIVVTGATIITNKLSLNAKNDDQDI